MPITQKMKERADAIKQMVSSSSVDPTMKEIINENVDSTLEACNGLTMEEKIQSNSENNFTMACLLSRMMVKLEEQPVDTWKSVIVKTKTQLLFVIMFICGLLAFRPELSNLIVACINK